MKLLSQAVEFDFNLLRKYDRSVPRYTSYPPATELKEDFREIDFKAAIAVGNYKNTPLSLYCHIPFCESPCYFCGCNTVITQRKEVAEPYLDYIGRDIERIARLVDRDRQVQQLHWGGGTPNYLSPQQVEKLWTKINDNFKLAPEAEVSIEVNPRFLDKNYIFHLRDLGFNRISFGIQDFNPKVQEAVNRIQTESMLFEAMEWIRDAGFESVNVDLIYGLPYQTLDTFKDTISKTLKLNPDRIAVFNFAYVPWLKPIQKNLPQDSLPLALEKLSILQMTIEELTSGGYVFIGMDHFAKPDDELAIAQREGELHRNFQGYTTKPESDLLSFGMTSISMLQDVYVQNHKRLRRYYQAIDNQEFPIERGVTLTKDDIIRRSIIMELMCQFQLDKHDVEEKYHLSFDMDFEEYFAQERYDLRLLEADGLLHVSHNKIQVTPNGRLLIRNIASAFDKYLKTQQTDRFSKAV
ncbi:oxygen-independent coproporphyrinogen III oxidase [Phormidium sp. LEGE 05292]|uniref:oxygen-independent coproporphyrinogen III oxidase n=1 Tax=[Phormidium] sp. LEGE 05292 TaxID=767427 RepID=UPI00187E7DDD|nr:oxygen-independent coproporphyrinogen III oxidase [Phormidium sp. LEGE 05292]MBE9228586.1 oxygen-independent coproporphyrinogen III oxidase [Phormidium sp. LEGE 05292]